MANLKINPTKETYDDLNKAYEVFNERLFGGKLPRCLVTLQRKSNAGGFFANKRFTTRDGATVTDEIALNPQYFKSTTTTDILSTLVHEMCHQHQYRFGKPSRGGYHNQEWADTMKAIGLQPSSTGKPGGEETGQRMNHLILEAGVFAIAAAELIKSGCDVRYVEPLDEKKRKVKAQSKTKYTCPKCGLNAWAKPDAALGCAHCGICEVRMEAPEAGGNGELKEIIIDTYIEEGFEVKVIELIDQEGKYKIDLYRDGQLVQGSVCSCSDAQEAITKSHANVREAANILRKQKPAKTPLVPYDTKPDPDKEKTNRREGENAVIVSHHSVIGSAVSGEPLHFTIYLPVRRFKVGQVEKYAQYPQSVRISFQLPGKRNWQSYQAVPDNIIYYTIEDTAGIIYDSRQEVPCDMIKFEETKARFAQQWLDEGYEVTP